MDYLRNLTEMLKAWLGVEFSGVRKKRWASLFFVVIWAIWRQRNKVIFEKEKINEVMLCELIMHC